MGPAAIGTLVPDDFYGIWMVGQKALAKDQKEAAEFMSQAASGPVQQAKTVLFAEDVV